MTWTKYFQPDEKVALKLTPSERKLVLEGLLCLDEEYEQIVRAAPAGKPVMMTLDELDDFAGYVAAEANHTEDKSSRRNSTPSSRRSRSCSKRTPTKSRQEP